MVAGTLSDGSELNGLVAAGKTPFQLTLIGRGPLTSWDVGERCDN